MRDPKRIKKVLNLIEKIWEKFPDQRFYQLVSNYLVPEGTRDAWFIEDAELEKYLKKVLKKLEK